MRRARTRCEGAPGTSCGLAVVAATVVPRTRTLVRSLHVLVVDPPAVAARRRTRKHGPWRSSSNQHGRCGQEAGDDGVQEHRDRCQHGSTRRRTTLMNLHMRFLPRTNKGSKLILAYAHCGAWSKPEGSVLRPLYTCRTIYLLRQIYSHLSVKDKFRFAHN
jgi:hypothetical protein